ncbi:hypothetical protein [Streptomyces sp. NPDC051561]|uniref:hypothetical protein n=1 Tax=Streptomyces sp. NPDC051561 TaxID=3365658 RepID=UPI0037AE4E2C
MTTEPSLPRETDSLPLDSTAELLTRITAQLSTQLGRISPDGSRREGPRLEGSRLERWRRDGRRADRPRAEGPRGAPSSPAPA